MPTITYQDGDTQSRMDAVNSVEGAKFSISEEEDATTERREAQEDERVFTTPRGVEVVRNPTDQEYQQMRAEAYQDYPWLWGTGEPVLRHTYDRQGNEYYWRADQAVHAQVEPYINQRYGTQTSQQWQWWTRDDADEWPTDYGRQYSVEEEAQLPTAAEEETRDIISTMPVKAQQYLRRAESYLTAKVGNLLSVPRYAQREYLRDIVREISLEYLREGRVSDETINDLFDRAYDEGVVVDREFYDPVRGAAQLPAHHPADHFTGGQRGHLGLQRLPKEQLRAAEHQHPGRDEHRPGVPGAGEYVAGVLQRSAGEPSIRQAAAHRGRGPVFPGGGEEPGRILRTGGGGVPPVGAA